MTSSVEQYPCCCVLLLQDNINVHRLVPAAQFPDDLRMTPSLMFTLRLRKFAVFLVRLLSRRCSNPFFFVCANELRDIALLLSERM